eukprot:jgi/Galph1/1983/GphlegSOOS_G632.1
MSQKRQQDNTVQSSYANHNSRGWRAPRRSSLSTNEGFADELIDFGIPGCDKSSSKQYSRNTNPFDQTNFDIPSYSSKETTSTRKVESSLKKLTIETNFPQEDKEWTSNLKTEEYLGSRVETRNQRETAMNERQSKPKFPPPLQPNPPLPSTITLVRNNRGGFQGEPSFPNSRNSSTPGTPSREGTMTPFIEKPTTGGFPSFLGTESAINNGENGAEDGLSSPHTSSAEGSTYDQLDTVPYYSQDPKFTSFTDQGLLSPQSDMTTETRSRTSSEEDVRSVSSVPSASGNRVFFPPVDSTSFPLGSPSKKQPIVPFVDPELRFWQEPRRENCLTRNELAAIVDRAVDRRLNGNSTATCTKLIELCNDGKTYVTDILLILCGRQIVNDAAMTLKCLYLMHRMCREGPIDCIWQARHDGLSLLDSIAKSWTKPKNEGLAVHPARSICSRYASFLLDKFRFHLKFPEFESNYSLDRFFRQLEIEQVDETQTALNNQRYLKVLSHSTLSRLLHMLESIIRVLKNMLERRHLGVIVDICFLPEEMMQVSVSEQEDMINNFEELHKILRSTFQIARSHDSFSSIDIPELSPVLTLPNSSCQRPESRDASHIKCHFHSFASLHRAFQPEYVPETFE